MSGHGGGMSFWERKEYQTSNIELNPPSYYWQILINPTNTKIINQAIAKLIKEKTKLPKFTEKFSLEDNLFIKAAIQHIKNLFIDIGSVVIIRCAIALLLPFVVRFANYQKSQTNITHIKQDGLCRYVGWENDFISYLIDIRKRLDNRFREYSEIRHQNMQGDIMSVSLHGKYKYFVTSPPYANYRDYSKLFKIEKASTCRFKRLKYSYITDGITITDRTKTQNPCFIPLLPIPLALIEKYKNKTEYIK